MITLTNLEKVYRTKEIETVAKKEIASAKKTVNKER